MQNELSISGVRDRLLALRSLEALSGLDEEGFALLAEYAAYEYFKEGEYLLHKEDPIEHVFLVLEGAVEVIRLGKRVSMVRRDYGVGFLSTLARDPHGVDAIARENTVALSIPVPVLLDTYEENFSMVRNSLRLAAISVLKKRGSLPFELHEQDPDPPLGTWRDERMTLAEGLLRWRDNRVFDAVNLDALIELNRRMVEFRAEPGKVLWKIGDPSTFSYRIDYGHVRCTNAVGESVLVGSDFVLGFMDSFAKQPRSYDAVTVTKFIGLRNDVENFLAVLEGHHNFAAVIQGNLARVLLRGN